MTNYNAILIAQQLTSVLAGAPDTNYATVADIVYGELLALSNSLRDGSLSAVILPDGTVLSASFTPDRDR